MQQNQTYRPFFLPSIHSPDAPVASFLNLCPWLEDINQTLFITIHILFLPTPVKNVDLQFERENHLWTSRVQKKSSPQKRDYCNFSDV